ncbi:DNA-binding protein WhiA [Mycoplasma phocoenae]|uniref:Probable cell division protein WhiA n=1 Tax=Mycoplasma phocoenae TaxID=754517 RepID=A0A858U4G9_9MOLU|nr:DNA-binding protein WhiA [Mycoplasma phocoenae]QJG66931.1 DNA-binding protein WhiA [Mycoplasma phocoenae]
MTFTQEIKDEIIKLKLTQRNIEEFIRGIIYSKNEHANIFLIINNADVLSYIKQALDLVLIKYEQPRKNGISFTVSKDFMNKRIKKQQDFFAGLFLVTGSVSDVNSTLYHLEIKVQNKLKADEIVKILSPYGLQFKYTKRKEYQILYIKKVEQICDFLKAIGAIESYFQFEKVKIERDMKNSTNRLINFDYYNLKKIAKVNVEFNKAYEWVINNKQEQNFTKEQMIVYKLKNEDLGSSLNDLVILLEEKGIKKSKSVIYYYIKKIIKFYNDNSLNKN